MSSELTILIITAFTLGFTHTLFGPDHYLPFIVMSKARKWSTTKTLFITIASGLAHVLSSVVLGLVGLAAGIAVFKLETLESLRGDFAAWMLLIFGFTYLIWGIFAAVKNKPHTHKHAHEDGNTHAHEHAHAHEHTHVHETKKKNITPWILFTIFLFGPCEPLIPLIMYPAAKGSMLHVIIVASVFAFATVGTMTAVVMASIKGLSFIKFKAAERYIHVIAGSTIFMAGIGVKFLGL